MRRDKLEGLFEEVQKLQANPETLHCPTISLLHQFLSAYLASPSESKAFEFESGRIMSKGWFTKKMYKFWKDWCAGNCKIPNLHGGNQPTVALQQHQRHDVVSLATLMQIMQPQQHQQHVVPLGVCALRQHPAATPIQQINWRMAPGQHQPSEQNVNVVNAQTL